MNINVNLLNKIDRKCLIKKFIILILLVTFKQIIFYIIILQNRLNLSIFFSGIYNQLYFSKMNRKTLKPIISKNVLNYSFKEKKGVCLCTICKNEKLYILEFVQYYQKLGYKKIVIFDNNDINGEKIDRILKYYISNNLVEIIDVRGLGKVQLGAYHYCYEKNHNLYDWISFFDIDEFLYIKNNLTINNYIYNKRFQKCQSIILGSKICDDNNLERYDSRPLNERFKNCQKLQFHAKSIVRGKIQKQFFPTAHIVAINLNYFCDSNGKRIFPKSLTKYNFSNNEYITYIKHFYTKTAEEFCVKISRGGGETPRIRNIKKRLKSFLRINKITKNKIKILEKCTKVNLTKLINKKK